MSEISAPPARPVSLFTVVFLFLVFASFWFVVRYFYDAPATGPQNLAAENLPDDMKWRATSEARRAALQELRKEEAKQSTTYGWADKSAGTVQLPIERAMELTAQQYGAKK